MAASTETRLMQLEQELTLLRRELANVPLREATVVPPYGVAAGVYRGITAANIGKGGHGNVTRYNDGTNTPSGDTDDVYNDFIDVGAGKIVIYVKLGSVFYLIAVECPPT